MDESCTQSEIEARLEEALEVLVLVEWLGSRHDNTCPACGGEPGWTNMPEPHLREGHWADCRLATVLESSCKQKGD